MQTEDRITDSKRGGGDGGEGKGGRTRESHTNYPFDSTIPDVYMLYSIQMRRLKKKEQSLICG